MSETAYILLGSNLGDRIRNLQTACEMFDRAAGCTVVASSPVYNSAAIDLEPGAPDFLNQAIQVECDLPVDTLLALCEEVERSMGRINKGDLRSRLIDCDILLYGRLRVETPRLTVPHPRLLQRPFALVPLLDLIPQVVHPVTGRPLAEYLTNDAASTLTLFEQHVPNH